MSQLECVAIELLYSALEGVRLLLGEEERDDFVGLIVGQVCDLQHSIVECWREEYEPRPDDELPF
jgi:hypothetical protein